MIRIINTRNDVLNTPEHPKITENVHKHPIVPLHTVCSQIAEVYFNKSKCSNFDLEHKILTKDSRDDPTVQCNHETKLGEARLQLEKSEKN